MDTYSERDRYTDLDFIVFGVMTSIPRGCRVWMRKEQKPSVAAGGASRKNAISQSLG